MEKIAINWFRKDLRLDDNPSLSYLSNLSLPILNIFIWDEEENLDKPIGSASKIWLYHSLLDLNNQLENKLLVMTGKAENVFKDLIKKYDIRTISWNRCYEPWRIKRDKILKTFLENKKISVKSFNGSLLWEPWNILKKDSTPYKVYSPFFKRGCLESDPPRKPILQPSKLNLFQAQKQISTIDNLKLFTNHTWTKTILKDWDISKVGAEKKNDHSLNIKYSIIEMEETFHQGTLYLVCPPTLIGDKFQLINYGMNLINYWLMTIRILTYYIFKVNWDGENFLIIFYFIFRI